MSYCIAQHELWCWAFTKTLHGTRPHPDSASGERGPPIQPSFGVSPSLHLHLHLPSAPPTLHPSRPTIGRISNSNMILVIIMDFPNPPLEGSM